MTLVLFVILKYSFVYYQQILCTVENNIHSFLVSASVNQTDFFSYFSFLFSVTASVNQIGNETVVEGDSVSLNCNAMGSPDPFIAWSKTGGGVISQDRWLNITNITKADRGQYQCFANNTCGSDFKFTSINVQCKILQLIIL